MQKQSRAMSLVEVCSNTFLAMVTGLLTQMIVFPMFGIAVSVQQNLGLLAVFTLVSIVRSYLIRRLFEVFR